MFNPGSPEAIKKGCTCCPENNHHGKGTVIGKHEPLFFKDEHCVHHGIPTYQEINKAMETYHGKR